MKRYVGILLYDEEKRFLLQQRTADAPKHPGKFGTFGGKAEKGETPEMAVRRECMEELDYELENPKLAFQTTLDTKYGKIAGFIFLEKYNPNKKLVLHEGENMRWVSSKEFEDLDFIDSLKDIVSQMYNEI